MPESILDEAKRVIQDRRAAYDEREQNFTRIAAVWSVVFGHKVTPEQVALCMIGMKLAREIYKPSRDTRVDICGYADCLEELVNANPAQEEVAAPCFPNISYEVRGNSATVNLGSGFRTQE